MNRDVEIDSPTFQNEFPHPLLSAFFGNVANCWFVKRPTDRNNATVFYLKGSDRASLLGIDNNQCIGSRGVCHNTFYSSSESLPLTRHCCECEQCGDDGFLIRYAICR